MLASGTRLGPYEITARLGAGGMGEVYRARDTRLDRPVAIKVLPEAFSRDTGLRQRLDLEARAISQLSHPHICTLHDIGDQDGAVRQVGPPAEVYDHPADTFVATFLGSPPMNLVPRGDRLVGFRPEHFLPVEDVPGASVTVPFKVDQLENLSGDRHVYGTVTGIGDETRVIARLPTTVTTPIVPGETHEFAISDGHLRFFDTASGLKAEPVRLGA